MAILFNIVVFFVAWWLVLFMVLPFGVKTSGEAGEGTVPGTAESAPHKPLIVRKLLITTAIAAVIWLIYWLIVRYNIITLDDVMK